MTGSWKLHAQWFLCRFRTNLGSEAGSLKGWILLAPKALQRLAIETKELLGGMKENNIISQNGVITMHSA